MVYVFYCTAFQINQNAAPGTDIPSGAVEVHVKYRGILVYMESEDLCKRASCPVGEDGLQLTTSQMLPAIAPPVRTLSYTDNARG